MMRRSSQILFLSIASVIAGFVIGRIDTSKNWDDTGITVGLILLSTAALGVFGKKMAWLWAVLVAVPIVLLNITSSGNYGSMLVFVFAFAGAYAGFVVRSALGT